MPHKQRLPLRNGVSETSVRAAAGWSSGAMVARYTRALSGELAVEEFKMPYDTRLNRCKLGVICGKLEISVGNDFAYLCRQFHKLETHRQRDTAFNGENPAPSA